MPLLCARQKRLNGIKGSFGNREHPLVTEVSSFCASRKLNHNFHNANFTKFMINKLCLFVIAALFFITPSLRAQEFYYGLNGAKINLEEDKSVAVFVFKENAVVANAHRQFRLADTLQQLFDKRNREMVVRFQSSKFNSVQELVSSANVSMSELEYVSFGKKLRENGEPIQILNRIGYQLKKGYSLKSIESIYAGKAVAEMNGFIPVLRIVNPAVSATELARQVYESGAVEWSAPDTRQRLVKHQVSDYYAQGLQYYLNQSNGVNINAPNMWSAQLSSASIKVAVIDDGVEDHPDLRDANGNNRIIGGWTPNTGGNGRPEFDFEQITQSGQTFTDIAGHGVACAGIVAALHNSFGTRGVAPNVQFLTVNIFPAPYWRNTTTAQDIANGIIWAFQNGADVISNSWGYNTTSIVSPEIVTAFNRARAEGRGGKGCVVVVSAGNIPIDPQFPSNVEGVVCVAALTKQNALTSYSARGSRVNLCAFGGEVTSSDQYGIGIGDIYTTDRQGALGYVRTGGTAGDYVPSFSGTSAACPQVLGCAAAILSANPNLTESQVRSVMNTTASPLNISGTGNGRLNTYLAVKRTLELYGGTISGVGNLPNSETWNMQPNVAITVAQGTSINTTGLIFQPATGSNWGGIYISSDNSTFNSCQFLNGSGGSNYMVFVRGYN